MNAAFSTRIFFPFHSKCWCKKRKKKKIPKNFNDNRFTFIWQSENWAAHKEIKLNDYRVSFHHRTFFPKICFFTLPLCHCAWLTIEWAHEMKKKNELRCFWCKIIIKMFWKQLLCAICCYIIWRPSLDLLCIKITWNEKRKKKRFNDGRDGWNNWEAKWNHFKYM